MFHFLTTFNTLFIRFCYLYFKHFLKFQKYPWKYWNNKIKLKKFKTFFGCYTRFREKNWSSYNFWIVRTLKTFFLFQIISNYDHYIIYFGSFEILVADREKNSRIPVYNFDNIYYIFILKFSIWKNKTMFAIMIPVVCQTINT